MIWVIYRTAVVWIRSLMCTTTGEEFSESSVFRFQLLFYQSFVLDVIQNKEHKGTYQ